MHNEHEVLSRWRGIYWPSPVLQGKSEFWIEAPARELSATSETCDRASKAVDAGKITLAIGAAVKITPFTVSDGKRKCVAACFVSNCELVTRDTPLGPVRGNMPAIGAKLREQVRELVPEGALNLGRAVAVQPRIERDELQT